jgi:hypothetical protein
VRLFGLARRVAPLVVVSVLLTSLVAPFSVRADEQSDALSATEILSRASQKLANTQTVRFKLDVDGDTYVDSLHTLKLIEAEGDLVRPDRVRTSFKIEALGRVTVTIQLIIVDGQWWTTDLITGKWGPAPADFEYDPSVLFDNQGGIGPVMDRVTDAQRLDDEEIDGRETFHIQAEVADDIIDSLTYHTIQGTPITVDLWIDQETNDLLRARLAEPPGAGEVEPSVWSVWTLDLFDHDAKIEIEAPD